MKIYDVSELNWNDGLEVLGENLGKKVGDVVKRVTWACVVIRDVCAPWSGGGNCLRILENEAWCKVWTTSLMMLSFRGWIARIRNSRWGDPLETTTSFRRRTTPAGIRRVSWNSQNLPEDVIPFVFMHLVQWVRIKRPDINPHIYSRLIFMRAPRAQNGNG